MGIVTGTTVDSNRSGHGPRAMAALLMVSVASVTVLAQGTRYGSVCSALSLQDPGVP